MGRSTQTTKPKPNAVRAAQDFYTRTGGDFLGTLNRCLLKGIVISVQNEVLLLAEPGLWDGETLHEEVYDRISWNCWIVRFLHAPGYGPGICHKLAPFPLPWVAFWREGRKGKKGMRVIRSERF